MWKMSAQGRFPHGSPRSGRKVPCAGNRGRMKARLVAERAGQNQSLELPGRKTPEWTTPEPAVREPACSIVVVTPSNESERQMPQRRCPPAGLR